MNILEEVTCERCKVAICIGERRVIDLRRRQETSKVLWHSQHYKGNLGGLVKSVLKKYL